MASIAKLISVTASLRDLALTIWANHAATADGYLVRASGY
jgi:hypothetical protein